MKIERIDLRRYGHFNGQHLDFSSHSGKLVIVLGPNEAGKTMTLNAIRHWLYGFPKHMGGESHLHGNEVMVGGRLVNSTTIECLRTRKNKAPLVAADGKTALPLTALHSFLGDITVERFVNLFGLSHAALREGGKEIAEGGGHLGQALFAAASGLTGLRNLRRRIAEQVDALYVQRGQSKRPLNVAKREYEEAKSRLKQELVSAPDVEKWTKQADEAKTDSKKWSKVREDAQRDLRDMQCIASARPLLKRRSELISQLESMREIPRLRTDFAADWKPLPGLLAGQRQLVDSQISEITRLEGILTNMPIVDIILSESDKIEKLHAMSEQRMSAYTDKINAEQLVRDTGGEAKQALREIGLDPADFDHHIETLRIDPPIARRLRKLVSDLIGIEQEIETRSGAREDIERGIKSAEASLRELSPTINSERVELLAGRLDQGDPFATVNNLDTEIRSSEQELNALTKRLGSDGDWGAATVWAIPTVETLRAFEERFAKEDICRRDIDRDLSLAQSKLRKAEVALASAESGGAIPLPGDWESAKALRDATWASIQGVWLDGRPSILLPDELAARFRGEIKDADGIADRLRRDAERVSRKGQASVDIEEAQKAIEDRKSDLKGSTIRSEEAKTQWQNIWQTFGLVPETPKAMLEWRVNWEALVKAGGNYRTLVAQREAAARRRDDFLTEARTELGDDVAPGNVVALIRRRHSEANSLRGKSDQITANLKLLREGLPKKIDLEEEAKRKRQNWEQQWQQILERLPVAVQRDLDVGSASDLIDGIDKFRGRIDFRKGRQREVEKAEAIINQWDGIFNDIASSLGELTSADNPVAHVSGWKTRLGKAREIENNRKSFFEQLGEHRRQRDAGKEKLASLEERLRGLQCEIGAHSFDDIPEILRKVEEKVTLERQLEMDCESPLRDLAAGRGLDDLEAIVRVREGQDLADLIEAVRETMVSAEANRDRAVSLAAEADAELDQLHRKQGGLTCRAEMESALARMKNLLPEYVVAVLAEKVLDRAVERYRERNQEELFGSASAYFRCLTCGSFEDLIPDENEKGESILVGLRASERVTVEGMSEGTCDQLYLALRLAHLTKHMRDHGPFPVIFDDILMAFDDQRALTALKCLADLAGKTQVFMFTHHDHIREMAMRSTFSDRIGVVEMPSIRGNLAIPQSPN